MSSSLHGRDCCSPISSPKHTHRFFCVCRMKQAGIAPALPRGDSHALGDSCNPWPPTEADLKLATKYKKKVMKAPQQASADSANMEPSTGSLGIDDSSDSESGQHSSSSSNNSKRGGSTSPSCLPAGGVGSSGISGACSSLRLAAQQVGGGTAPNSWRPMRLPQQKRFLPCSRSSGSAVTTRTLRY